MLNAPQSTYQQIDFQSTGGTGSKEHRGTCSNVEECAGLEMRHGLWVPTLIWAFFGRLSPSALSIARNASFWRCHGRRNTMQMARCSKPRDFFCQLGCVRFGNCRGKRPIPVRRRVLVRWNLTSILHSFFPPPLTLREPTAIRCRRQFGCMHLAVVGYVLYGITG
jgi:hypothetical protein